MCILILELNTNESQSSKSIKVPLIIIIAINILFYECFHYQEWYVWAIDNHSPLQLFQANPFLPIFRKKNEEKWMQIYLEKSIQNKYSILIKIHNLIAHSDIPKNP